MSKLDIVLCAVLFALAADAYLLPSSMETAQQRTNITINTIVEKFEAILKHHNQIARELDSNASTFESKICGGNWLVADETIDAVYNLPDEAWIQYASDDCFDLYDRLDDPVPPIIISTGECIDDSLVPVHQQIQSIKDICYIILLEIDEISKEAQHCVENVDSVKSVNTAIISCVKTAAVKATEISEQMFRRIENMNTELNLSLKTVESSLANCTINIKMTDCYNEWLAVIERIKNCFLQTPSGEKASSATEISSEEY